jgi:hypothetical protein
MAATEGDTLDRRPEDRVVGPEVAIRHRISTFGLDVNLREVSRSVHPVSPELPRDIALSLLWRYGYGS